MRGSTVYMHVHVQYHVHTSTNRRREPYNVYMGTYLTPLALRDIHSGGGRALLTTVLKCSSHGAEHNIVCEGERERLRGGYVCNVLHIYIISMNMYKNPV